MEDIEIHHHYQDPRIEMDTRRQGDNRRTMAHNMACLAIVLSMLLLATTISLAQAHNPTSADCMSNPFASQCRGISAKRSLVSKQAAPMSHSDGAHTSMGGAWTTQWLNPSSNYANRIHQTQSGSLSDLLMRLESGLAQTEQVVSRPIVGKLYLYEQLPSANSIANSDRPLDLVEGREEH